MHTPQTIANYITERYGASVRVDGSRVHVCTESMLFTLVFEGDACYGCEHGHRTGCANDVELEDYVRFMMFYSSMRGGAVVAV